MKLANSISFLVFGTLMRFLPVIAPSWVISDPTLTLETSARALWLIVMGYAFGGIGAYYLLKEMRLQAARGWELLRQRALAAREARELAHARQARLARSHAPRFAERVAIRVQY